MNNKIESNSFTIRQGFLFCLTIALIICFLLMSLSYYGTIDGSIMYISVVIIVVIMCIYVPLLKIEEKNHHNAENYVVYPNLI